MAAAKFNYIGYGPNNDPDMIEAICGPGAILKLGGKVTMLNTQLCVARLDQTLRDGPSTGILARPIGSTRMRQEDLRLVTPTIKEKSRADI